MDRAGANAVPGIRRRTVLGAGGVGLAGCLQARSASDEFERSANDRPTASDEAATADGTMGPLGETGEIDPRRFSPQLQTGLDGHVVPIADGLGVADAIPIDDPTPVQNAIDRVAEAGGGVVRCPPSRISSAKTYLRPRDGVFLQGSGWDPSAQGTQEQGTVVEAGLYNDTGTYVVGFRVDSVRFVGNGHHGAAIRIGDGGLGWSLGRVAVADWNGQALLADSESFGLGQSHVKRFYAEDVDPGASDDFQACVWLEHCGPQLLVEQFTLYPADKGSGSAVRAMELRGGNFVRVNGLNVGGFVGSPGGLQELPCIVDQVNFEPSAQPEEHYAGFHVQGDGITVNQLVLTAAADADASLRWAYETRRGPTNDRLGRNVSLAQPLLRGGFTLSNGVLVNQDDPTDGFRYDGPSSEVTNNASDLSNPIVCLGDLEAMF